MPFCAPWHEGQYMSSYSHGLFAKQAPAVICHVQLHFICWFRAAKCQFRFHLERFWQLVEGHGGEADRAQSAWLRDFLCPPMSVVMHMHAYVSTLSRSHAIHKSCQCICITSKNRGHAKLFYLLPIYAMHNGADAVFHPEAFFPPFFK